MKWLNKFLNYSLGFTVLVCFSVFIYIYYSNSEQRKIETEKYLASQQPTAEELVNKYIKQGSLDVNRQKLHSLNTIRSNAIDPTIIRNLPKEIPIDQIPIELQIAKDKSNNGNQGQALADEFNQKNNQFQMAQIEDQQARKEYARQFIENARKNGYHITLSDDLQVTSVSPIRKPTNENDTESFESQPSH